MTATERRDLINSRKEGWLIHLWADLLRERGAGHVLEHIKAYVADGGAV